MLIKRGGQVHRRIPTQSLKQTFLDYLSEPITEPSPTPIDHLLGVSVYDRIPFTQSDTLKNLSTDHVTFTDLRHLMEAEETDILLQERKLEQQSAEWIAEKEAVEQALSFYAQPENEHNIFEVTYMPDGTIQMGKHPHGFFIRIEREMLETAYLDVNRFKIERESLHKLIKIVKNLEKGTRIDGQYERPALVAYLEEKKDYWQTKPGYTVTNNEDNKRYQKNARIYTSLIEQVVMLPVKEDGKVVSS